MVDEPLDMELPKDEGPPIPVETEEAPVLMYLPRRVLLLGIVNGLVLDLEELAVENELVLASDARLAWPAFARALPVANEELKRTPNISTLPDGALLEAA